MRSGIQNTSNDTYYKNYIFDDISEQFNGIKDRICEENGAPRRFINIYINEEDIRFLEGEKTTVNDGDEISIIPAIAGGVGA